jgi:4-amino-4-deoxy-L-arabinose transferase-like glycosyltransferase
MVKNRYYYAWFLFSLISLTALGFIGIGLPFRGDERHIVETIRLFAKNLNFGTIKNYPEVTPPFFFIFYAMFAKIFGQSIESLRFLTLIISFITWQVLYFLNFYFTKNYKHSFLLSILIIVNPYFFGTSLFVFTDMLTILLSFYAIISFLKDRFYPYLIFSMLAILCRQYAIIFPLSVIIFSFLDFFKHRQLNKKYFIGSGITFIPLIMLFFVWGNIAPVSGMSKWVISDSHFYNISYLNTYITFSVIYLLPLIIIFLYRQIKFSKTDIGIAIILSLFLMLFPINVSAATLQQTDIRTVGIVHIGLIRIFGENTLILKIVLLIFLLIGCYINVTIINGLINCTKNKLFNKEIVATIIWLLFLIIMPFSYQVWEKYLSLVLPFLALSFYLNIYPSKKHIT